MRIGFIGTGGIAVEHLTRLARIPEAEVVALYDADPGRVETAKAKVAERTGVRLDAIACGDAESMLRNERLDAVYVCVPPFAHGEPEHAVLRSGAALFVEKPVALDLRVASDVLDQAQAAGVVTATGYQSRYGTEVQRARSVLASHTVAMASVMRFGRTPGVSWYAIQSLSGGHVIEMATHQVDLLRYLVGEITTVYSAAATRVAHRDRQPYDIFDVNCSAMTFANGAVASFTTNLVSGHGKPPQARGVHIFCDGLTFSILGQEGEPRTYQFVTAEGIDSVTTDEDSMLVQDAAFVDAVARQDPSGILSDYANGVMSFAVTLANDLSARRRGPVDVHALLAEASPALADRVVSAEGAAR